MAETSNARKRARDEEENGAGGGDYGESLENNLVFSDTLIALRMMRAQFPKIEKMSFSVKRLGQNDNTEVFEWFKQYVIESKFGDSIQHEELCALLSYGGRVKDEHVTFLINAGLLTRQLIDPNLYWFSIPNIGSILKGLSQGRKELLSFLNRRKYKEMLLAPLEKKRLRLSPLDMRFHLRDLIGSGHLRTVQTPTGLLVRVSKD
ncbi:Non-specific serine/threonine protein kinase protein [Dioscorea alata]|uniref:Non-specific serine/threonine protein kinase protein n=1 Tax=Dioscorea alata TaxID=55571 RepID=A0ACB7WSK7_DIOAL|nr:Non-specific serine/threonine protein kinase protein [Dioscorea alata]